MMILMNVSGIDMSVGLLRNIGVCVWCSMLIYIDFDSIVSVIVDMRLRLLLSIVLCVVILC